MSKPKKILGIALVVIATILFVGAILSLFSNTDNRFLKMLDFPRIQFFITALLGLIVLVVARFESKRYTVMVGCALLGTMIIQSYFLINYTPLVATPVESVAENETTPESQIAIVIANVKMSNRNAQPFIDVIKNTNPDIIIALEVDDWWDNQLRSIENDYPYTTQRLNDVCYGMTLYSKRPLINPQVRYVNNEQVPSIESTIILKNDKKVKLYAVHPVPPKRFKKLPDNKGQKEKELIKLGKEIEKRNLPVIVAGDINDVSWGATDRLTGTKDLLHDVRVGRWFYNSYNANNIFMRWPLDYFLVTNEIKLVNLERLDKIGSDHYPIFATFSLSD